MNIEFISYDPLAMNFAPEPLKKWVPEWYKNIPMTLGPETIDGFLNRPAENETARTVRHCIPVLDYLTSGYVIRASAQTLISKTNTPGTDIRGLKYFTSDLKSVSTHGHAQCPVKIDGEKKTYLKINNPWLVKTPPGYSTLFFQPFYQMEKRFVLLPAIVDTDKHNVPVNFPGYLATDEEVQINPGDPLMAVFPFKRDEWKMSVKDAKTEPSDLIRRFLMAGYRTLFWSKKSYK